MKNIEASIITYTNPVNITISVALDALRMLAFRCARQCERLAVNPIYVEINNACESYLYNEDNGDGLRALVRRAEDSDDHGASCAATCAQVAIVSAARAALAEDSDNPQLRSAAEIVAAEVESAVKAAVEAERHALSDEREALYKAESADDPYKDIFKV